VSLLVVALVFAQPASVSAGLIVPGDLYSSNYFSDVIEQYTPAGAYLSSYTLPSQYGSEVRGIVEGPDHLLYATTITPSGFGVVAIDNNGVVEHSYSGTEYVEGNLSFGKIAFATNGQFFVAGQSDLVRFTPGVSTGTVVYSNGGGVFDVTSMPSGDLLVLSGYDLQEITTSGLVVRTITPSVGLGDARGVAYNPATNDIYVTMLGYTNEEFQLMELNGNTGAVIKQVPFTYGDDMYLASGSRLLVGSRTQSPGIFDLNLNQIGTMGGDQQMFVTQAVPEPSSIILCLLGGTGIWLGSRRRRRIGSIAC
jgi:hypothetical protein